MSSREDIHFELVPKAEIPSHDPITQPPSYRRGSKWDKALNALEQAGDQMALKIVEPNKRQRNWHKSTLLTRARNIGFPLEVREHGSAVYAFVTDKGGRFSSPVRTPKSCLQGKSRQRTVMFCGKSLNLSELARQIGVSPAHVSFIFAGKRQPSLETAERIAAALGMSFGDFAKSLRANSGFSVQRNCRQ